MERFHSLIDHATREGFSDIHITGGHPLVFRSHGSIIFDHKTVYSHAEMDDLVAKLLTTRQMNILRRKWSVDFAASSNRVRMRINAFKTTRGLSLAIRLLSGAIPTIEQLNLHPSVRTFCRHKAGLLLICGATGSGKSTTIASLIHEIINTRNAHVVTLEDPIEYRFKSAKSFVEQRELGTHIRSFDQGLIDVLREDPDVIVVGELREAETIRLTLNAAESGHLVIATLHASNVEDAAYRICNAFPPDAQEFVRFQLSSTLVGMIIQSLVYMERARFRVPVLSIMHANHAIRGLIRENRFSHIENTILMSHKDGMYTKERYLNDYLSQISAFSPPARVFMPSEETTHERVYESPLTAESDAEGGEPEAWRSAPAGEAPPRVQPRPATAPAAVEPAGASDEVFGHSYHLEPEEDLATVLQKIGDVKK